MLRHAWGIEMAAAPMFPWIQAICCASSWANSAAICCRQTALRRLNIGATSLCKGPHRRTGGASTQCWQCGVSGTSKAQRDMMSIPARCSVPLLVPGTDDGKPALMGHGHGLSATPHRDEAVQVRLPAPDRRRPAQAQRRGDARPRGRAGVELGHEVLLVQDVVEDAGVHRHLGRHLRGRRRPHRGQPDAWSRLICKLAKPGSTAARSQPLAHSSRTSSILLSAAAG